MSKTVIKTAMGSGSTEGYELFHKLAFDGQTGFADVSIPFDHTKYNHLKIVANVKVDTPTSTAYYLKLGLNGFADCWMHRAYYFGTDTARTNAATANTVVGRVIDSLTPMATVCEGYVGDERGAYRVLGWRDTGRYRSGTTNSTWRNEGTIRWSNTSDPLETINLTTTDSTTTVAGYIEFYGKKVDI